MYRDKKISLVIPALRAQHTIAAVLDAVPALVDRIYVIDDASPDVQAILIHDCAQRDRRIRLVRKPLNRGTGAAILMGYQQSAKDGADIFVTAFADGSMNLLEMPKLLDPLIEGRADYTKGNRLRVDGSDRTMEKMPPLRFSADWFLHAFAKLATGYFRVSDPEDGFAAIQRRAYERMDWSRKFSRRGYALDMLMRLNAHGLRVEEVPRSVVAGAVRNRTVLESLSHFLLVAPMLVHGFMRRIRWKYFYQGFHPLLTFYYAGFALVPTGVALLTTSHLVLGALLLLAGLQFLMFAMLFDREESEWDSKSNSKSWSSTFRTRITRGSASSTP